MAPDADGMDVLRYGIEHSLTLVWVVTGFVVQRVRDNTEGTGLLDIFALRPSENYGLDSEFTDMSSSTTRTCQRRATSGRSHT